MSQEVQELDPLEISFSNDKGFEPSTPSEGSPPPPVPKQTSKLHIHNPIELWEEDRKKHLNIQKVTPFRVETPPSRNVIKMTQSLHKYHESPKDSYLKKYETRFCSLQKKYVNDAIMRDSLIFGVPRSYSSVPYKKDPVKDLACEKKKKTYLSRWNGVDATSHLKDISRLNDLINRVSTHINVYGRAYPQRKK